MSVDTTELRILAKDLHAAPGRVGARLSAVARKGAMDVVADGQVLAPKDTAFLAGSIGADIIGDGRMGEMGFEAGPTAEYGPDVEYGTQPHIIRPTTGEFLRFQIGGRTIFVRQVNHPGTPPQPYMGPSFDRNLPGIIDAIGDAGEKSVL